MTGGGNATSPSGRQHSIRHGGQLLTITEVGAGIREYLVDDRPVLDGYGAQEMCTGARGHHLIPWPNRIRDGRYGWRGRALQLDLTEPEKGGAIHGLTRWALWRLVGSGRDWAALEYVLHACPGWPFVLACRIEYGLDDAGLTVRTTVTNVGAQACPYGSGAHPYLTLGDPRIDAAYVEVPAATYLPVDEGAIPVGRRPVAGTPYDLRAGDPLGDRRIDITYTDLARGADGLVRAVLSRPGGPRVVLWADEAYPYLEVFTGDTLPEPQRRRTGLGVEPMTCAPDAFNSGDGLIVLEPGEGHSGTWGISPG